MRFPTEKKFCKIGQRDKRTHDDVQVQDDAGLALGELGLDGLEVWAQFLRVIFGKLNGREKLIFWLGKERKRKRERDVKRRIDKERQEEKER